MSRRETSHPPAPPAPCSWSTPASSCAFTVPATAHARRDRPRCRNRPPAAQAGSQPRRAEFVFDPYLVRGRRRRAPRCPNACRRHRRARLLRNWNLHRRHYPHRLLESETADEMRGRVFATFDLLWQLGRLVSLIVGGLPADTLGIQSRLLQRRNPACSRCRGRLDRPSPTSNRPNVTSGPKCAGRAIDHAITGVTLVKIDCRCAWQTARDISRCVKRSRRVVKRHGACRSVDGDDLARQKSVGGVAGADDCWDSVLARYQGGVRPGCRCLLPRRRRGRTAASRRGRWFWRPARRRR
jgi:hypothetical protein